MIKEPQAPPPVLFEVEKNLDTMLRKNHPLVVLSHEINWDELVEHFKKMYSEEGRPAKSIRLMISLHYLKYLKDLSDDAVVAEWLENPYWQYFSGETHFKTEFPIDPTSMTKFRNRIKEQGAEKLLEETINAGLKLKVISQKSLERVAVDTTVQEKNITYPTDGKLYRTMIVRLGTLAKRYGIQLRQSYRFVSKDHLRKSQRFAHNRKMKLAKRETRKLRTILGRMIRDIRRQGEDRLPDEVYNEMFMAMELYDQKREDTQKIYSIHANEVHCISKGKAGKKYEFGNKVGIAATLKEGYVVGACSFYGNPYDGATLDETVSQVENLTGVTPSVVTVDKGYRGHNYQGSADVHIRGVHKAGNQYRRKLYRRHSLIEAVIGHMKCEYRLNRNRLWGIIGDGVNAIMSACAYNLKKLMKHIASFFALLIGLFFVVLFSLLEQKKINRLTFAPCLSQ